MVFQDPLVVSVFSARIIEILRKYVDKSSERIPLRLVTNIMQMITVVIFFHCLSNLRTYAGLLFLINFLFFNIIYRKKKKLRLLNGVLPCCILGLMHFE